MSKTVWSFDLGKASIGEAVRDIDTNDFVHKASLLIPAEFASTKDAATRRRMWRTRQAHKAREAWLDEVWSAAGLEPLQRREVWKNSQTKKWELKHPADERLEREFPAKGDNTCYTSCLLRIKLLRGEKLEPWQIYKALHSAIQRRGYDPDIPWKAKESGRRKKSEGDEEAGTRERMDRFVGELQAMSPTHKEYQLPCYFDAWKMKLWNPEEPNALSERIDCHAESTRNQIVPRKLVEEEIRLLADAAGKQIEGLKGKADYLLWGTAGTPYASYDPGLRKKFDLREGGAKDWQGVVGQKVPRFDNRIIEKCVLIPRLNVCKIKSDKNGHPLPESRVIFEVTFLMKLKNMRVQRTTTEQSGLTSAEIKAVFEDPKGAGFKITVSQWKKFCVQFGVRPLPGYEEVEAPRTGGRSRFCRPTLGLLKRLILSGCKPSDFYREELALLDGNTDPKRGLIAEDLKFLEKMGSTWEGIYIPNQKLDAIVQQADDCNEAIRTIIGSQNDPIVRHRLGVFYDRLKILRAAHGVPKSVALEFVREDFMGKRALIEYRAFLKKRETERNRARTDAAIAGATERGSVLKLELLRQQGGICLYKGDGLFETRLDQYEIEHIVPRSKGGPDSVVNYVLTTHETNKEKGNQTPFEWLSETNGWDAYVQRVRSKAIVLRNKKVKLLLNEDAAELAERYTALAETAWISKLSQAILSVFFGWKNGVDENGTKRITIVNGGLTARIRRKYKLNSILNPDAKDEEEAEKKNRGDDRHHALDAMVISFIPSWTRDEQKEHFFRLPKGVNRETFAACIADVIPQFLNFEKAVLAETIYGREKNFPKLIFQRVALQQLAFKPISPAKATYDTHYALKQTQSISDNHLRGIIEQFLKTEPDERAWIHFCSNFHLSQKNGNTGSKVITIKVKVGKADEFIDLSKDGSGAWRKAKQGHKGQIIYIGLDKKPRVKPIYVFDSVPAVTKEIINAGGIVYGFFRSGCLVSIDKPIAHDITPLEPGIYRLNTLETVGRAKVTSSSGKKSLPISISKFIEARLKPIDALMTLRQLAQRKANEQQREQELLESESKTLGG
ncbi:MAG: type II CRISPR RNA-guided endonuclease Cas9 [Chthoniobacteraceae bacterium]